MNPKLLVPVWVAVVLHAVWACLLLAGLTSAANSTALNVLLDSIPNPYVLGVVLMAVAVLAFDAIVWPDGWRTVAFLLPQQLVLGISAAGAIYAVVTMQFADGVTRPMSFILADQLPVVLMFLAHTASIITVYVYRVARKREIRDGA